MKIDTSSAGFTKVPCYFAWLNGALWNSNNGGFFPVPFQHIHEPSIAGFTFRIWMPLLPFTLKEEGTVNNDFESRFIIFAREKGLYVNWLGMQSHYCNDQKDEVKNGNT